MKLPIADCRLPIGRNARRRCICSIGNRPSAASNFAFTLIEIMIVVGIIGMIAAMGVPSIVKALQKEGLRKAVSDVEDVFFLAREKAIFENRTVEVDIYPRTGAFGVEGTAGTGTVVDAHTGKTKVATLPGDVKFADVSIFRQDYGQSEPARIFFNPDGTCDEVRIVLISKGKAMKIMLDYATGLPESSAADQ